MLLLLLRQSWANEEYNWRENKREQDRRRFFIFMAETKSWRGGERKSKARASKRGVGGEEMASFGCRGEQSSAKNAAGKAWLRFSGNCSLLKWQHRHTNSLLESGAAHFALGELASHFGSYYLPWFFFLKSQYPFKLFLNITNISHALTKSGSLSSNLTFFRALEHLHRCSICHCG
jgi:hypothetical protein